MTVVTKSSVSSFLSLYQVLYQAFSFVYLVPRPRLYGGSRTEKFFGLVAHLLKTLRSPMENIEAFELLKHSTSVWIPPTVRKNKALAPTIYSYLYVHA